MYEILLLLMPGVTACAAACPPRIYVTVADGVGIFGRVLPCITASGSTATQLYYYSAILRLFVLAAAMQSKLSRIQIIPCASVISLRS